MVPETPPLCDHVWTGTQIRSSSLLRSTHLITTQPGRRPFCCRARGARAGARSGDVWMLSWGRECAGILSVMACSQDYVSLLIVPSPFSLSSGIISATFCCFVLCNSSSICSGRMGTPTTEPIKSGRHINRVRNRCFIDTRSSGHSSRQKQGSLPANAAQSCEFRLLLRGDA